MPVLVPVLVVDAVTVVEEVDIRVEDMRIEREFDEVEDRV